MNKAPFLILLLLVAVAGTVLVWSGGNDGDDTFTPYLTTARKRSYGAAWADYDGDGDPDLVVTRLGENLSLYRNNKAGTWLRIRALSGEGRQTC